MTEQIIEYNGKKYRPCSKDELETISKARNNASKPANFSILYGGGVEATVGPLLKTFPNLDETEARRKAEKALIQKKGVKKTIWDKGKKKSIFEGGMWSAAFSYMAEVAFYSSTPTLPMLKSKISTALRPEAVGDDFVTGRLNFSIQGSGSEILAAFLTACYWLCDYYKINAQFVISVHDETIFIVPEKQVKYFVVIMQIAHLMTWALFHDGVGIYEMPLQRAYFSGVAIDKRARKSPTESTETISNHNWQNEANGEELTMLEIDKRGYIKCLETRRKLIERGLIR